MTTGKLLCVDDDAGIRALYRALFESYGYAVFLARSGAAALEYLKSHARETLGIISDFEMPGMNGAQLAAATKRAYPNLPFILISGSPRDLGDAAPFIDLSIAKGLPVTELMESIESVLVPAPAHARALAGYLSLGSALAGIASVAFLLSRLL